MSEQYIVDMHCHFIPGVDDGSRDMETTLAMLKIASEEGITHVVATPHYKRDHHNASPETLKAHLLEVQQKIKDQNIPVNIYLGNEIMFFSDLEEYYEKNAFLTMNNSRYLLVEYYPDDDIVRIRQGVDTVLRLGLIPVLAHVERYLAFRKNIDAIEYIKKQGAKIQVNASSVVGEQGFGTKQFVKKLLKAKLVDFVGTDAHTAEARAPRYKKCSEYLYKKYDESYVDAILYKNAIEKFGLQGGTIR